MSFAIEVENLWFRYVGSRDWVLKDVSFTVRRGETVVIMGPSGCGKSTLLYILSGMAPRIIRGEMKGSVRVLGRDVSEMGPGEVARYVGFVFQNPEIQVLMPSIIEELVFGLENLGLDREEIGKRVSEILEFTGFRGRESPQTLSPGEKQLLAIASVLALKPQILVLDEPTSMLDHVGTKRVLDLIARIKSETGMTLLIVEHRIEWIAEHADRVVVMSDGRVVASGSPRDVFSNKELVMSTGIRPPQITEVFYHLHELTAGKVRSTPITLAEGLELLKRLASSCSIAHELGVEVNRVRAEGETVIEVRDVWFRYSKSLPWVLKGVNLDVRRGEVLAIIGHSGAGKTTLAKHLNGLLKPVKGYVRVMGLDTRRTPTSTLSRIVGLVFQNPEAQFFTSSIWEEMTVSLKRLGLKREEIEERVKWALKVVDLDKPLDLSPHLLSFGEKHRLAIASILAMEPAVIVLDEPFSGLDYKRSLQLLQSLKSFVSEGGSVVLIAHDLQLISEVADRIAVLENRRIVRVGRTEEILSDADWLIEHEFTPLQTAIAAKRLGLQKIVRARELAEAVSKCLG